MESRREYLQSFLSGNYKLTKGPKKKHIESFFKQTNEWIRTDVQDIVTRVASLKWN